MLLERGATGDRSRALELLRDSIEAAEQLGMKALLERASALESKARAEPSAEAGEADLIAATPRSGRLDPQLPQSVLLRREGDYWTLADAGSICRLKNAKGLQYVAVLLRHPGQEFHALDLVQPFGVGKSASEDGARREIQGGKLELLDAPAKAAYRSRLVELRTELEEADQFNDSGRAARLQAEIEAISEQLAAAVGLGGRDRHGAMATERARSTVTHRIKTAIRKIGERHPALANHLMRAVKTGTFCVYCPDPMHPITWVLDEPEGTSG